MENLLWWSGKLGENLPLLGQPAGSRFIVNRPQQLLCEAKKPKAFERHKWSPEHENVHEGRPLSTREARAAVDDTAR